MLDRLGQIELLVLDVDGVLTNAHILITEEGQQLRSMNVKDGFAIKYAISKGLKIVVISGGKSEGVRKRMETLGVHEVHLGVEDKLPILKKVVEQAGFDLEKTAYLGDDVPDLPALNAVGLSACPADAEDEVITQCDYVCRKNGGEGCVRELIRLILANRDQWIAH
jgi:3-deoxy-D-manno-octulosonate 8-phosphate phosphatase (KDO 8-P phosphatase)